MYLATAEAKSTLIVQLPVLAMLLLGFTCNTCSAEASGFSKSAVRCSTVRSSPPPAVDSTSLFPGTVPELQALRSDD